jgi:hypothetical protein
MDSNRVEFRRTEPKSDNLKPYLVVLIPCGLMCIEMDCDEF